MRQKDKESSYIVTMSYFNLPAVVVVVALVGMVGFGVVVFAIDVVDITVVMGDDVVVAVGEKVVVEIVVVSVVVDGFVEGGDTV